MVVLNEDGGLIGAGKEDVLLIEIVGSQLVLRIVPQPCQLATTKVMVSFERRIAPGLYARVLRLVVELEPVVRLVQIFGNIELM